MNSRRVGNIGLGRAIAYFTKEDFTVCVPLTDSQPYDLIVEKYDEMSRVSVKFTNIKTKNGKGFDVGLRTTGQNSKITKDTPFDKNSCDLLFVACSDGQEFLIPSESIENTSSLSLPGRTSGYSVNG